MLLAAYNGAAWIRCQLESILAQRGVDVRISVRDDCSSDATIEEIARFAEDDRLTVTRPAVAAGSAAQNFLALIREGAADSFDFVAFADQDDVWHAGKLERACRMLSSTDSVGYSSATIATWPDGRTILLRQATAVTGADFLFEGAGQGCTFVLRADFYARIRHFVQMNEPLTRGLHYHDWMVYALARAWGSRWAFDAQPSASYRQHEHNDTGARTTFAGIRKRLALIRRGWYRSQIEAIAGVCVAAAPTHPVIDTWWSLLRAKRNWLRTARVTAFCFCNGRRKRHDNMMLVLAALAGWI